MKRVQMRKAFSMITAIFVIVIMASIGALVVSTSGKIVKTTTAQYQHEQAVLYAKSYTEFAVMAITANDWSSDCIQDITGTIGTPNTTGDGYRIKTHIAYIVNGAQINTSACDTAPTTGNVLSTSVKSINTPLTAIIDTYIDYKDPDNTALWRTVHRRTVQKI